MKVPGSRRVLGSMLKNFSFDENPGIKKSFGVMLKNFSFDENPGIKKSFGGMHSLTEREGFFSRSTENGDRKTSPFPFLVCVSRYPF